MRKIITIVGVVFIILGISSMALGFMDILVLNGFSTDTSSTINVNSNTGGVFKSQQQVLDFCSGCQTIQADKPIYTSIKTYFQISSTVADQQFDIQLGIIIHGNTNYCTTDQLCLLPQKINGFTVGSPSNPKQGSILTTERTLTIPLVMSDGIQISTNTPREYQLIISSNSPFSFVYKVVLKWRIFNPLGFLVSLIGLIVVIIGVVLKAPSGKTKKLKTRSWQEPTLGGTSNRNSARSSYQSSKSSKGSYGGSPNSVKASTSVNCKKCGGVMPRNSQYCPHCYTKQ